MYNYDDLRFTFTALLAVTLVVGLYFRLRSHTRESLDRRQEGWAILVSLRLTGLAFFIALIAWLYKPAAFEWTAVALPAWVRWSGVGLYMAAAMWMCWMFRWLGSNLTDTVVTRKSAYMVRGGPYRWVRHPMYAAVLPLGLAIGLITANLTFFALAALAFTILRIRTDKEERNLLARFGPEYGEYMRCTGRFFPLLIQRG